MSFIKTEDIKGYRFDSDIVCPECAIGSELQELEQTEIITNDEVERSEGHFFCDRCNKVL